MIFAQISDLHLRADGQKLKKIINSKKALAAAVSHLKTFKPAPDLVLATGDLVHKGTAKNYRALRRHLDKLKLPVYVIPGNHDDRELLRDTFADWGYLPTEGKFLHYTVEDHPLRLIGLDTVNPGSDGGMICTQRLQWLDARLAEGPGRPTVIFMHHPPFKTGIGFMDRPFFMGAAAMEAVVRRHPQVERVICGHVHRPINLGWGGAVATVAPSIAFQISLALAPEAPSSSAVEPPALPIFLWRPDTGIIGHMNVIGKFSTINPAPQHSP
jgi:3',5'-cyclic AMP phosphodiesterase CpdA